MFSRIMKVTRAMAYAVALLVLSGTQVRADGPSDCPENAIGGQTGQSYHLVSQSLATETTSGSLSVGGPACGVGGSTSGSFAEQYHIGYYLNESTNTTVRVDCRTGRIIR
jgi:hypothetical protein